MDLVGFAPVSRWEHAPRLLGPLAVLPGSRSVAVAAVHITDTWTEMGGEPSPQDRSPGGWQDQNSLLAMAGWRAARLLSEHGHEAIAVPSSYVWRYRPYADLKEIFTPAMSHLHAAIAAGLGEIGWSGLALTPEFGARCRFITVVTRADLAPTPLYDGPALCDRCMECARHCPSGALRKELQKPNEFKIEEKTYRYAGKNLWRCAWAEHFNLDLDSKNLAALEKIGESEIFREMKERGFRGHERGVCQKFCVPPHLRSGKKSFGRDLRISQNRINRRYPENMPTLRKIRDDLFALAVRLGAETGAAGEIDPASPVGKTVSLEAPGMRRAIAVAIPLPPEAHSGDPGTRECLGVAAYFEMHHLLLRLARQIEDCGYNASSYTCGEEAQSLAAAAGLGSIGPDGVFRTPEWGVNALAGAVATDAPLDVTRAIETPDKPAAVKLSGKKGLRGQLERLAAENFVDLFGVAPAGRFDTMLEDLRENIDERELGESVVSAKGFHFGPWEPKIERIEKRLMHPADYIEGAKSVIVLGTSIGAEAARYAGTEETQQVMTYGFHKFVTWHHLLRAAGRLARRLSSHGHRVAVSTNLTGVGSLVRNSPALFGLHIPDARCNSLEAVAAGLGQIGKNGALLTPEYGAQQRVIAIVTDAELPADPLHTGKDLCGDCRKCADACPMRTLGDGSFKLRIGDAVIDYPRIPRHRCDWSQKYSLCPDEGPAMMGDLTSVRAPSGKITIEDIQTASAKKDLIQRWLICAREKCLVECPSGPQV
jgi:epoxyqueuosine reductase QueG